MKVVGLISIFFSFLAFKTAHAQSCITNYNSAVYRIETNATTISIKTTQSLISTSLNTTNTNTIIPWKTESETQQGVTSLFSCITVHQYAFLLITPSINEQANGNRSTAEDVRIVTYNYESQRWRLVPLDLWLVMHPWTLISFAWHQQYIVYNTQRKRAYYFDTQHWSWNSYDDNQQPSLRPPTLTTTPEITVVGNTMYYLYNDDMDPHSNHIYVFDIPAAKWKGHFASFWSNTSSFVFSSSRLNNALYVIPRSNDFKDRFMRIISLDPNPKGLYIQTPTADLPSQGELVTDHIIVDSNGQDEGDGLIFYNGTTLIFYQPSNNTVTAIYGETFGGGSTPGVGATTFPDPTPDPPPFWSTAEGQRTKVALSCSLSLGMVIATLIGVVVLQRRRRQRQGQLELAPAEVEDHQEHQEEQSSHREIEKTNSPQEEVTTTVTGTTMTASPPSMQSLSFLNRDNAMVWGKNVHQLLALIAFHHHRAGDQSPTNLSRSTSEYPSMIRTSSTVSGLTTSSRIISIGSTSHSATSFEMPTFGIEPATPVPRRSLDMACPLPRNTGSW